MRRILIAIALVVTFQAHAQLARESGSYTFHQVVRVAGDKHNLYTKASEWVTEDHDNIKNVVQYASEEKGQIIVKSTFDHHTKDGISNVQYICTIQFRNGMYKESYSNFKYVRLNGKELSFEDKKLKAKTRIVKDTDLVIASLSNEFKEHMMSKVTASEK